MSDSDGEVVSDVEYDAPASPPPAINYEENSTEYSAASPQFDAEDDGEVLSPDEGPASPDGPPFSPTGPDSPDGPPFSPNEGPESPADGSVSQAHGPASPEGPPFSPNAAPDSPEVELTSPYDSAGEGTASPVSAASPIPMEDIHSPPDSPDAPVYEPASPDAPEYEADSPEEPDAASPISEVDEQDKIVDADSAESELENPVPARSRGKALLESDDEDEDDVGGPAPPAGDSPSSPPPFLEREEEPSVQSGSTKRRAALDSSDDEQVQPNAAKRAALESDDDEDGDFAGFDEEMAAPAEGVIEKSGPPAKSETNYKGLMEDIFGDSDDEDEEFEGFGPEVASEQVEEKKADSSGSEDEMGGSAPPPPPENDRVSVFDLAMEKAKDQQRRRNRRRKDENITELDDMVNDMVRRMREAGDQDQIAHQNKKIAVHKLKMLPEVSNWLKKIDLHDSLMDAGVLSAMKEWLALLPDRSLPNLQIRTTFLKALHTFPPISSDSLKDSGLGKSIMLLVKHPHETKENRVSASRLISEWARPIFQVSSNMRSVSREDRREHDKKFIPKFTMKDKALAAAQTRPTSDTAAKAKPQDGPQSLLKPGDNGFMWRARVPQLGTKDFVNRPKSTLEPVLKSSKRRETTRIDRHVRNFQELKRTAVGQRAVSVKISEKC